LSSLRSPGSTNLYDVGIESLEVMMKNGKRGRSLPKKLGFAKADWSKHRLMKKKAKWKRRWSL
jgi:hypothetical protein